MSAMIRTTAAPETTTAIERLQTMMRKAGNPVEIEAGPACMVVYGPSSLVVSRVVQPLLMSAKTRDPKARAEEVEKIDDEPAATSWCARVLLDWSKFSEGGA